MKAITVHWFCNRNSYRLKGLSSRRSKFGAAVKHQDVVAAERKMVISAQFINLEIGPILLLMERSTIRTENLTIGEFFSRQAECWSLQSFQLKAARSERCTELAQNIAHAVHRRISADLSPGLAVMRYQRNRIQSLNENPCFLILISFGVNMLDWITNS